MKKIKALAIFNALSLLVHVAFSWLTQAKMINPKTVGEVSAQYESLFTPAPLTFGIWIIIYTALAVFCLYHIGIAYKHDKNHPANTILLQIDGLFIFLNLASAGWLVAWTHGQLFLSVVLIFLQLACLVIIHWRLKMYDPLKPATLKVGTQFPLSIYLGWLSVAAIANTSSYLVAKNWDGFGLDPSAWAIILISFSIILSAIMIFIRRNIYFGLVVAWGLYGIIVKRNSISPELYAPVIIAASSGIGIIVL
ncbi:MAG: hypothetical protein H7Y01_08010, partial [Ferruginibacter sp.]|nr:hypothetical protein [Chitinophagaceae bacterium]